MSMRLCAALVKPAQVEESANDQEAVIVYTAQEKEPARMGRIRFALPQSIESRLFGVHARDITVVAGAALLLALTAAAAAYRPARRASRVDTLDALRYE